MKRTRLFAFASTAALLVASVFATKAMKRFTSPVTIYYKVSGAISKTGTAISGIGTGNDHLVTTVGGSSNAAHFTLSGTSAYTLCTTNGTSLYWKL